MENIKISCLTEWYEQPKIAKDYIKNAPKIDTINWFDLPPNTQFMLKSFPKGIKQLGRSNFVSLRRLKQYYGKETKLNQQIIGIKRTMIGSKFLRILFPINLNNRDYVQLYSLMNSEGYHKSEFSIQVPEDYFHTLFKRTIRDLISTDFSKHIITRYYRTPKSFAPAKTRQLVPVPKHLPLLILNNREFSRDYLKIAFDAEGSAILNKKRHKRYIKLSRYTDISKYVKEKLPLQKRVYINTIKKEYKSLFEKIKHQPPPTLFGEYILLKKHFKINSLLKLEAIKRNSTAFRAGGITARWVLYIYAENINRFIREINFISKIKRNKCKEMLRMKTNKSQYSALRKMKKISKNSIFMAEEFISNMKKEGYTTPSKFIWDYNRKGLIKKIGFRKYKILL